MLTHSLTHPLTHSLTHSLAHSLTHSLNHSLASDCTIKHSNREGLQSKLETLVREGKSVSEVTDAVAERAVVSLSFLSLQLHARGGQEFWRSLDDRALAAYMVYRLADIYADVLTKVEADGYNPTYCRKTLEWLSSERCCDSFTDQVRAHPFCWCSTTNFPTDLGEGGGGRI